MRLVVAVDGINHSVVQAQLGHGAAGTLEVNDRVNAGIDAVFDECLGHGVVLQSLREDEFNVVVGGDVILQIRPAGRDFIVGLCLGNADHILLFRNGTPLLVTGGNTGCRT